MFNSQHPHSHMQMSQRKDGEILVVKCWPWILGQTWYFMIFIWRMGFVLWVVSCLWSCYIDFSLWLSGTVLPQAVRNTGPTLWVSLDIASLPSLLLSFLYYSKSPPSWFIPFHFLFLLFPLCSLISYRVTNWNKQTFFCT